MSIAGVTVSLFLIAAGAILRWAVTAEPDSIDLDITGLIVFGVGCAGLVISLAAWAIGLRTSARPQDTRFS